MYNQTEAILSQYELEIHEVKKGRGTYICDTDKGMKLMVAFRGSNEKGMVLKELLEQLLINDFPVEQIMLNKNDEVVTRDEITGESFLVKDYITGRELDTGNPEELKAAVRLLALYHEAMKQVALELPEKVRDNARQVVEIRKRHQRELIKVKNFIRNRKKKCEFEQLFMCSYVPMLDTVEKSIHILEKQELQSPECMLCHGDVNQHNILCQNGNWRLVHFEGFTYSWSVLDLANFLRKIMEKNTWDVQLGMDLIHTYRKYTTMEDATLLQLYGLLLFPEKFWKITNHYMNSRKSWISERDIDKLKKVIEQEEERLNFMQNLFSFIE